MWKGMLRTSFVSHGVNRALHIGMGRDRGIPRVAALLLWFVPLLGMTPSFLPSSSGAPLQTEDAIVCLMGTAPVIDGSVSAGEWSDSGSVYLTSRSMGELFLMYKHDGSNLYVCFGTNGDHYAEIYIDLEHDGGYRPKADDMLLHISSALFEQAGNGLRWGTTNYDIEGWTANTMSVGDGLIECSISSLKMGYPMDGATTLGIGFLAVDTYSEVDEFYSWPMDLDGDNPNTWGEISFDTGAEEPENMPPQASIAADRTGGTAPLKVEFTGEGVDLDGTVVAFRWDFDDGATSGEQNPTHTFMQPRDYTVTLTVSDEEGATGTDSINITVEERSDDDGDQDDDIPDAGVEESSGLGVPIIVLISTIMLLALGRKRRPGPMLGPRTPRP